MKPVHAPRFLGRSRRVHLIVLGTRLLGAGLIPLVAGPFPEIAPHKHFPCQSKQQQAKKENTQEVVEQWRAAVTQHEPGKLDSAAIRVLVWPESSMQSVLDTLSAAAKVLARVRSEGGFQRTMDLTSRSREVQSILGLTEMELRNGDASRIAKLGAMFHTDLALLPKDPLLPYRIPLLQLQTAKASRSETLLVRDGIIYGSSKMTHWNHARRILDLLHPNPSRDATVRRWSIATSSILQQLLLLGPANKHLQWAQEVFPEDADIQFLLGSLHECLAAPRAQNVVLPPDFRSDIGPEKVELRTARQHFQQAQRINSRLTNAHLHLGRVEGLLGSHRESIAELRQAERAATDPQDQYYLSLFLGSGLEATGDFDGAKQQYQRAAQLYPAAQLPWLALSQLARRRGDLREAIAALERGLTLLETNDPWWEYLIAHVRNADSLLTEIRAEIGKLPR